MVQVSQAQLALCQDEESYLFLIYNALKAPFGEDPEPSEEVLQRLNAEQVTLWAAMLLYEQVMEGGFVQLIHNGYGAFFFYNPFAKALRLWGLKETSKLLYEGRRLYELYGEEIEKDCDVDHFMELYEQYEDFQALDDEFIENETLYLQRVATYVKAHLDCFVALI